MKSSIFALALLCVGISANVFKRDYGDVSEFLKQTSHSWFSALSLVTEFVEFDKFYMHFRST